MRWRRFPASPAALETLRAQARLQLEQYRDGAIRHELIPLSAAGEGRGLASLPLPSPGDVFLDLEADIFVGEGGLEYLFGLLLVEDGRPVYREVSGPLPGGREGRVLLLHGPGERATSRARSGG